MAGGIQQSGKEKQKNENEENDDEIRNLDDNISTSRFVNLKYVYLIKKYNLYFLLSLIFIYSEEEKPTFNYDIDQELAGLRKKQSSNFNARIINKGLGDWEKHTKGIGAKLLLGVIYKCYIHKLKCNLIIEYFADGLSTWSWFRKETSGYYSSN